MNLGLKKEQLAQCDFFVPQVLAIVAVQYQTPSLDLISAALVTRDMVS